MSRRDSSTEETRIQTLRAEAFLVALLGLFRTVKIHRENNRTVVECIEKFTQSATELLTDADDILLQCLRGKLYLQQQRLVYRREMATFFDSVHAYLESRGIQEIRFHAPANEAPVTEILSFARIINGAAGKDTPFEWIDRQIKVRQLAWVEVRSETSRTDSATDDDIKTRARKTYAYAMTALRDVARKTLGQKRAGIVKPLRIAQNMVDLMLEDEDVFFMLSTIRNYDDYTFSHSINVAVLSMGIGRRIGLSKNSLERLALCGMLHDIGKIEVDHDILNKPGRLTDEEMEEMKRHALNSVRLIVKIMASRDRKAKLLLPPFEHHQKFDLSGYPKVPWKRPLTLFGRIISIADVFDAITSPRVYRPSVMSPDQALGFMLEKAGTDFDPILLKVFINMLGVYPVGTLVALSTGEWGLVARSSGKSGDGAFPQVRLLNRDAKGGFKAGPMVSLQVRDPKTGKHLRHIVRSLHPSAYNIQPTDFLL